MKCRLLCALALMLALASVNASAEDAPNAKEIKVTLLGTGVPIPTMERFGPSILVEAGSEKLLFDCGRGATQRLYQLNLLPDVSALFLTHLHSDHVVGIPDFWLTSWIVGKRKRTVPLRVWGPHGTRKMMSHLTKAYEFDIHMRRDLDEQYPGAGWQVISKDIGEGVIYNQNGVKVTAFMVDHGVVKPALGYRIDYGGRSVVLSGDTRASENLVRFAQGAGLLIHEVLVAPEEELRSVERRRIMEHHTSPEDAGQIFKRVHPGLAVYSHIVLWSASRADLVSRTRATYAGPLEAGEDLMQFTVADGVSVHAAAGASR